MLLENQVALVTGSSRGIGAAIAKKFAAEGAVVIINYLHNQQRADELVDTIATAGGQAVALQADVRDAEAVDTMITTIQENLGTLNIVVNNALNHYQFDPKKRATNWQTDWSAYQNQIDGSVKGSFNVCQAALPLLQQQPGGRIINLVSNLIESPIVPYHDYITAKTALLGYTRTLASEVGAFGVQVNAIAPGLTYPTDSSVTTKNDVRERIIEQTPTGRLTIPEDIAGSAVFLASELSANITGQCLYVDGGLVMH
jgi:3-oxoacyl-[acyl-carrier protein] reductase